MQPVETSSRSSRTPQPGPSGPQTRKRFLPEPIETTRTSHHGRAALGSSQTTSAGPRRFKPEVIETDHQWDQGRSAELLRSRTEYAILQPSSFTPGSQLEPHWNSSSTLSESKFSYASLLRRQETRRHSFRVPELPSIPSNSSEESGESSQSPSRSVSPTNPPGKSTRDSQVGNISQESRDDEFSQYLLSLAARSARKDLREQALAAFPNEQNYEPVDHFAIDEEERDSETGSLGYPEKPFIKSRRRSSADLSWELEYMRQHKEEAEQRLRVMAISGKRGMASAARSSTSRPQRPSPPMLGDDIVIPRSSSPEGTVCENPHVDRGSRGASGPCTDSDGLWGARTRPKDGQAAGLWMGTCQRDEDCEPDPQAASGIMTPMILDDDNEVSPGPSSTAALNSPGQPSLSSAHAAGNSGISKGLEDEFNDGFVTQIYNYLSLGYPCMARYYDHELSQISGIAVEDLRRDDLHTDAKGHLMTPESELAWACTRWKALRIYIHEWAQQQPSRWEDESYLDAWGMPERRGSWAG